MTTGEKITKLRKQAGYSQEAFSEIMGVSRQAVSKWENDTAQPTNENLQAICKLFGVSISQLLDDEDITTNSQYAQNLPREDEINKRAGLVKSVFTTGAVLVLCMAVIAQSIAVNRLKEQLANIESYYHNIESRFSRLENRIDHAVYSSTPRNTADFVDSYISVEEYDFENDTATLKFSFIPTDYSRSTVAKVSIKSSFETKEEVATLENGMFTAYIQVKCRDDISTYVYLIDGENTRNFSMGMIENPQKSFKLNVYSEYSGRIDVKNGNVKIMGELMVNYNYNIIPENPSKSVYPVKAVLEIYAGDKLLKDIPHEAVMEREFLYTTDDLTGEQAVAVGNQTTFWMHPKETIENTDVKFASEIKMVYVVVDNNGREYRIIPTIAIS